MHVGSCFPAQVVGVRVPRTGYGAVHSVFARALNLSGGGAWLSVQSSQLPPMAHGIQVAWPLCDLREHFAEGGAWCWEGERLVIARRDQGRIGVSTQHAATWTSPLLTHAADAVGLGLRWAALWRECARFAAGRSVFWGRPHAHLAMWAGRARRGLRLLRRSRDARDVDDAVRALIGLGPGLTPAGDDALIGWLAGMALWPGDPVRDALVQATRCSVAQCVPRTTDVSRAHLEDALAGQFSQSLSLFANALVEACPVAGGVSRALEELARFGASSGLDAAAGLLAALSAPTRDSSFAIDALQLPRRTSAREMTEGFCPIGAFGLATHPIRCERRDGIDSLSVASVAGSCFPG